jgi:molybdopterin-containing oxidoreductase family membrane subunit
MVEKLLKGPARYYFWLLSLLVFIGVAGIAYIHQLQTGLGVTGMSRDVSWGLYISQFTYFVGVAASAVMLVLPAYFHHYKKFKRMIIFGEFMAISAVIMCMLFIVADMGQPQRMLNVILHPTPNSVMFFDMLVLIGYLVLNVIIGWVTLEAERLDVDPPYWIKYLVYLSIIWAFSIHTVTAFLYAGLPGRHLWLTAVLAGRFLASAFCSGPAILLLLVLAVKRMTGFDPGQDAIKTLAKIITYAMCINVFLFFCEVFTAFYSGIPGHQHPLVFLFAGHDGHISWVTPWMWACGILAFAALALLLPPALRDNMNILPWALGMLIAASWIDKGLGLIIGGFSPNVFETLTPYAPSGIEILITLGVYAVGLLVLSLLWKIAIGVKKEAGTFELHQPLA